MSMNPEEPWWLREHKMTERILTLSPVMLITKFVSSKISLWFCGNFEKPLWGFSSQYVCRCTLTTVSSTMPSTGYCTPENCSIQRRLYAETCIMWSASPGTSLRFCLRGMWKLRGIMNENTSFRILVLAVSSLSWTSEIFFRTFSSIKWIHSK